VYRFMLRPKRLQAMMFRYFVERSVVNALMYIQVSIRQ
jgi:hypothetical protein